MEKKRAFISFDFDNDEDLRNLLVGQSKNPDSPFEIANWSLKEKISGDWRSEVRARIKRCHLLIVICGEFTDRATGVSFELSVAQNERIHYFLLRGRSGKACVSPTTAKNEDKIYRWTWDNLKALISGAR